MEKKKVSLGLKILCFLLPLVGLIIFASNIFTDNKELAKKCGIASLIGFFTFFYLICFSIIIIGKIYLVNEFYRYNAGYEWATEQEITEINKKYLEKNTDLEDFYDIVRKYLELKGIKEKK